MISLAELQRRIDPATFRPRPRSRSRARRSTPRTRPSAPLSAALKSPRGQHRGVARHRRRDQGHHRYLGPSDRNGLPRDLRGMAAARGCGGRDVAEAGGRDRHRQDHDDGVRGQRSDGDAQSTPSRSHAGRIVIGFGGGRRRRNDSAGAGNADRRFGDPARLVLRRGRDQADLPAAAGRRREMFFVDAGYRRAVRGRRRGPRARTCRR